MGKQGAHAGHRNRMKEKLMRAPEMLSDHELIEIMLYYAIPQKDTNELAHNLLEEFGSIEKLLEASPKFLEKLDGIGGHSALMISVIFEVVRRYYTPYIAGQSFMCANDACEYAIKEMMNKNEDCMMVIFLDINMKFVGQEVICRYENEPDDICSRQIADKCLRFNCTNIILVHSHRKLPCKPTRWDVEFTRNLKKVLESICIKIIDHIILFDQSVFSFFKSTNELTSSDENKLIARQYYNDSNR